jgi:aspartyl protease family protein
MQAAAMFKALLFFCLFSWASASAWCSEIPRVEGYIGGQPVRFIVDTGASEIVIPKALAQRLGITYEQGVKTRYETAGGPVEGYRIVLESVKIANFEALGVIAHVPVEDNGLREALLGMSFLKNLTLTLHSGVVSFSP